jgi:hypothetical protein
LTPTNIVVGREARVHKMAPRRPIKASPTRWPRSGAFSLDISPHRLRDEIRTRPSQSRVVELRAPPEHGRLVYGTRRRRRRT